MQQAAFSIAEGASLDRIEAEMLRLARARHAFEGGKTEGKHLIDLGRELMTRAEA